MSDEKVFLATASDAEIKQAIRDHVSFVLEGPATSFIRTSRRVERLIEECSMTCQVYTRGRTIAGAAALLSPATFIPGLATLLTSAAHNAVSAKYDWEVGRNPITGNITATFVR